MCYKQSDAFDAQVPDGATTPEEQDVHMCYAEIGPGDIHETLDGGEVDSHDLETEPDDASQEATQPDAGKIDDDEATMCYAPPLPDDDPDTNDPVDAG